MIYITVYNLHTQHHVCVCVFAVPPKIESFSFPGNIQSGARVHVTCVVSEGDSPVKIVWKKDGMPLSSYRDLDVATNQISEYDLALRISSASPVHNGNYTCEASNSAAKASRTERLLVHGTEIVHDVAGGKK